MYLYMISSFVCTTVCTCKSLKKVVVLSFCVCYSVHVKFFNEKRSSSGIVVAVVVISGWGLLGVENLYHRCIIMLSNHLQISDDVFVKICLLLDMSLPSRNSICTRATKLVLALSLDVDLVHIMADDLKNIVCDQQRACLWNTLCEKPLHGKIFNWCSSNSVDMSRSFHWLSDFVYSESESTIFAIQDQVVRTRVYEAKITKASTLTVLCHLCNSEEENYTAFNGWMPHTGTNQLSSLSQLGGRCDLLASVPHFWHSYNCWYFVFL